MPKGPGNEAMVDSKQSAIMNHEVDYLRVEVYEGEWK